MNNGKTPKNTGKKLPYILLLIGLAVLIAAIALIATSGHGENPAGPNGPSASHSVPGAQSGTQTPGQTDPQKDPQETAQGGSQGTAQTEPKIPGQDDPSATEGPRPSDDPQQTDPAGPSTPATEGPDEPTPPPTVDLRPVADAEYEQWLAATMVICVSMEYPDFALEGIYTESATALADKYASEGVYIAFASGGERIVIHSKPLELERTAIGTYDISMEHIGLATFDRINADSVALDAMHPIDLETLGELIPQCLLVSILMH